MFGSSRGLPPMLALLFKLAWASRIQLPLLIATAFMVTNIHMRLEININVEIEEQIVVDADDIAEVNANANEENTSDYRPNLIQDQQQNGTSITDEVNSFVDKPSSDDQDEQENYIIDGRTKIVNNRLPLPVDQQKTGKYV